MKGERNLGSRTSQVPRRVRGESYVYGCFPFRLRMIDLCEDPESYVCTYDGSS